MKENLEKEKEEEKENDYFNQKKKKVGSFTCRNK